MWPSSVLSGGSSGGRPSAAAHRLSLRGLRTAPLGPTTVSARRFSEAVSFQVSCETQEEVDEFWDRLSEGGQPGPCGWLKDKYGLSWQIVPTALPELLGDPDPERSQRAMAAMMKMSKIDIEELRQAANAA